MGTLVDSSVLIRVERAARKARTSGGPATLLTRLIGLLPGGEEVGVSAITVSELHHGVLRASPELRAKRAAFVETVVLGFPPIPFDQRTARVHATIWTELLESGLMIGPHDLIIGATALSLGWSVVTLNEAEFRRIRGLRVVVPDLEGLI